jgi:hypothetical protein
MRSNSIGRPRCVPIVVCPEAAYQIAALLAEALHTYADVLGALELTPRNGPPLHQDNPDIKLS